MKKLFFVFVAVVFPAICCASEKLSQLQDEEKSEQNEKTRLFQQCNCKLLLEKKQVQDEKGLGQNEKKDEIREPLFNNKSIKNHTYWIPLKKCKRMINMGLLSINNLEPIMCKQMIDDGLLSIKELPLEMCERLIKRGSIEIYQVSSKIAEQLREKGLI